MVPMHVIRAKRSVGRTTVAFMILGLAGCSSSCTGVGDVSGTVRHNGQVLKSDSIAWTVYFTSLDGGRRAMADVGPDGSYSAGGVPTGPVKIAVVGIPRGALGMPDPKHPPARLDAANKKLLDSLALYKDPDRSGLSLSVRKGQQNHDIELR